MKNNGPTMVAATPAKASSAEVCDDSDPQGVAAKKKKADLLETTASDVEKLKERLKVEIRICK